MVAEAQVADEIIASTQRLLGAISTGDYATYLQLSADDCTAVEPETQGQVVKGLAFHKYFFDLAHAEPRRAERAPPTQNHICGPQVRMLGPDAAVIVYVRVIQSGGKLSSAEETRVWERKGGQWKNVHFHRSSRL